MICISFTSDPLVEIGFDLAKSLGTIAPHPSSDNPEPLNYSIYSETWSRVKFLQWNHKILMNMSGRFDIYWFTFVGIANFSWNVFHWVKSFQNAPLFRFYASCTKIEHLTTTLISSSGAGIFPVKRICSDKMYKKRDFIPVVNLTSVLFCK